MTRRRRTAALILAALVLLSAGLFALVPLLEAGHDCADADCPVCAMLRAVRQTIPLLLCACAAGARSVISSRIRRDDGCDGAPAASPVMLRDRLLN